LSEGRKGRDPGCLQTMILTALSAGAGVAGETIFKESVKRAYDNLLKGVNLDYS